ncbi:MAG: hypothetical protein WD355_12685 [Balneolaceae bacterium]
MVQNKRTALITGVVLLLLTAACGPSLVIQGVDYAQPVESVLIPGDDQTVHDQRYAIRFSIAPLLAEEGVDSVDEIRLIRNSSGYYFVTAAGFTNVYVMNAAESELQLQATIEISGSGLGNPAFNQRGDHIELVDLASGNVYRMNEEELL